MVPVFGYCLWYAKYKCRWKKIFYGIGVTAVILAVGTSSMYFIYQITHTYDKVRIFDNNQIFGYVSGGEYIIYGTDVTKLSYDEPKVSETVQMIGYRKGDLSADFWCRNMSDTEEGYVELPLFFYKGYHAYAGAGEELECVYGDNNVIRVLIPPGFSERAPASVRFESPFYWRVSEVVSWVTWLAIVVYCVRMFRRRAGK